MIAVEKGLVADAGNTLRQRDAGQTGAAPKGTVPNTGHALRQVDADQSSAAGKGVLANAGHALRQGDAGQMITAGKGAVADTGQTLRQRDAGQTPAFGEGVAADAGHTVTHGDVLEAAMGNPSEARAWTSESVEITPYDEIFADIVIRVDNAAEVVVKGYSCVYLSEEAILVSGIKHKDIEALVAMTGAKSWMHYLK